MYPLNFDTCTLRDVIARSVACHPSVFCGALLDRAEVHARSAAAMHDSEARHISADIARAANVAAVGAEQGDTDAIVESFLYGAFIVACRLQLIPLHVRVGIVERCEATIAA